MLITCYWLLRLVYDLLRECYSRVAGLFYGLLVFCYWFALGLFLEINERLVAWYWLVLVSFMACCWLVLGLLVVCFFSVVGLLLVWSWLDNDLAMACLLLSLESLLAHPLLVGGI